jgi:hypothetical protein
LLHIGPSQSKRILCESLIPNTFALTNGHAQALGVGFTGSILVEGSSFSGNDFLI